MILLDGVALKEKIVEKLRKKVVEEKLKPKLATILVGDDSASELYVSLKQKACLEIGGEFELHKLPASSNTKQVVSLIKQLNEDDSVHGILLQLPLPEADAFECLKTISLEKDVDGLNPASIGAVLQGKPGFLAATAKGIISLLDYYEISVSGKNALVIGRSPDVGLPTAGALLLKNATVTIAHSKTKDLQELILQADVVVSSASKPGLVTNVKKDAVVIDVGTNFVEKNGKKIVVGDVSVKEAGFLSPVPGGVGPMTIASLLENLVTSCSSKLR